MSVIWTPRTRTSQPQGAVGVDWSKSINSRLSLRLLFNEGGGRLQNIGNGPVASFVPVGAPTWSADSSGRVLLLDGTSQYVQISSTSAQQVSRAADITSGPGLTLSAWVKFQYSNINKRRAILGGVNASGNTGWACGGLDWLDGAVSTQPRFTVYDGGYKVLSGSTVATVDATNKWHHIAGVLDTTAGLMRLYINGAADGTLAFTKGGASLEPLLFRVGSFPGTDANTFNANGPIQDARVYRRALSADEVRRLYVDRYADLAPIQQPIYFAASAGGLPTLSAAQMTGITTTGGYPRVSYAY